MIYISTGGHHQWPFQQAVEHLAEAGIPAFELSGGLHVPNVAVYSSKSRKSIE